MQTRYLVLCLGLSLVGSNNVVLPNVPSNMTFAPANVTEANIDHINESYRFDLYKSNVIDTIPVSFTDIDFFKSTDSEKSTQTKSQSNPKVKADFRPINGLRAHLPLSIPESETLTETERKDVECIAWNLYFEVRGGTHNEQVAVAYVPINRLGKADFSDDICTNVFQIGVYNGQLKHQFSWSGIHLDKNWKREDDAWEKMQHLAMDVYKQRIPDTAHGATYFHSTSIKSWAPDTKKIVLGEHFFWQG